MVRALFSFLFFATSNADNRLDDDRHDSVHHRQNSATATPQTKCLWTEIMFNRFDHLFRNVSNCFHSVWPCHVKNKRLAAFLSFFFNRWHCSSSHILFYFVFKPYTNCSLLMWWRDRWWLRIATKHQQKKKQKSENGIFYCFEWPQKAKNQIKWRLWC